MNCGRFDPGVATIIRNADALKQELTELGAHAGKLIMHDQRRWGSTGFSGTRHELVYAFDGSEAVAHGEALIAHLDDHEFTIPGQLVADATVSAANQRLDPPRL